MAKSPRERLKALRAKPLYKIGKSGIDWFSNPQRSAVANKMLWLGYAHHDMPIYRAFDFFPELDRSDPRHWRVLVTYLSMALFPNPKKGARTDTISENAKLLVRCDELPEKYKSNDTAMLKEVMKLYYKDYNPERSVQTSSTYKSKMRNLRRCLAAAREHREYERLLHPMRTN